MPENKNPLIPKGRKELFRGTTRLRQTPHSKAFNEATRR